MAAAVVAVILGVLSGVHVYWACGGRAALDAAVPSSGGRRAFSPSKSATWAVAVALLAAAILVAMAGGIIGTPFSRAVMRFSTYGLGALFLARAIGDFRLVGFFKRARDSKFARLDTQVYAPLCLFLGLLVLYVAAHS